MKGNKLLNLDKLRDWLGLTAPEGPASILGEVTSKKFSDEFVPKFLPLRNCITSQGSEIEWVLFPKRCP